MNPRTLSAIRELLLVILANEMGCKPTDIAERFYFGALEPPMEYPL